VQDLVAGQGALIYKMWQDQGGSLYVCGKVAMARGVQVQRSLAGKGW
jgi:sulfite reductase alpha subunit-like flavoprotein